MKRKISRKLTFVLIFLLIVVAWVMYIIVQLVIGLFSIHSSTVQLPASVSSQPSIPIPVTKTLRNLNQKWDNRPQCDLNGDNRCDKQDFDFFQKTLGTCEGQDGYHPAADNDLSGCIDALDQHYLFPSPQPSIFPGSIIVSFKQSTYEDALILFKKYNLKYTLTSHKNNPFFGVEVPKGEESKWITLFEKEPIVLDADYNHINTNE